MSSIAPSSESKQSLRSRVISAAAALFYQRGFLGVSVSEIAEAAGSTKTSLYRYFRSKDELAIACLEADLVTELEILAALAEQHGADPLAQLKSIIAEAADRLAEPDYRGWMPANLAMEIADPAHPIRQACAKGQNTLRACLLDVVKEAGLENPEALTDSLSLIMHGAATTWQVSGAQSPARAMVETCELLIVCHQSPGSREPR